MDLRYASGSHYFYRLKGEYSVPMTPKGWFRRHAVNDESSIRTGNNPPNTARLRPGRRNKKILSQSMVMDVELNKVLLDDCCNMGSLRAHSFPPAQ